jgi:DNA-binding transcriptional ArsR family regulator
LSISTEVDILGVMKRATDPDVLLLQATADPTRLSILRQLSAEGAVCACDFSDCCDLGQPTVSHHLKVLRDAGWVTTERRGTWIYYSIRPEAVARFRELAGGFTAGSARTAADLAGQPRQLPVRPAPAPTVHAG